MIHCAALVIFLAGTLHAQAIAGLPSNARVIELRLLPATLRPHRALAIWAESPEDHPLGNRDANGRPITDADYPYTCPDMSRGWFWRGPTRMSLVDTRRRAIINTVKVVTRDGDDSFDVPYWIQSGYLYAVPGVARGKEGKPSIFALRDISGDGIAAEFALYDMPACAGPNTYVYGYHPKRDRLLHYPFELILEDGQRETYPSLNRFNQQKPIRPGRWDFRLVYNSGAVCSYRLRFSAPAVKFVGTVRCRKLP